MKVSFDFDSTLSRRDVQRFAKELVEAGHEVWIITTRRSNKDAESVDAWVKDRVLKSNKKLFQVADNVGIKREHIIFTCFQMKSDSIKDKGFLFHLDDDLDELMEIFYSKDHCRAINVEHSEWETDCRKLIEIEKYLENLNKL